MKKIILYVLCIQFVVLTGCPNPDNKEQPSVDSKEKMSTRVGNKLSDEEQQPSVDGTEKTRAHVRNKLSDEDKKKLVDFLDSNKALDPDATYQKFKDIYVPKVPAKLPREIKFYYPSIANKVDKLKNVKDIYFAFCAYTNEDVIRYDFNHPKHATVDKDKLVNLPLAVLEFKDDITKNIISGPYDYGTLESSSDRITIDEFYNANGSYFNFDKSFEHYKNLFGNISCTECPKKLTESIKFDYKTIKNIMDLIPNIDNIYFMYGAYTKDDANSYVNRHKETPLKAEEIEKKLTLILVYTYDGKKHYADIGSICPPPGSCQEISLSAF